MCIRDSVSPSYPIHIKKTGGRNLIYLETTDVAQDNGIQFKHPNRTWSIYIPANNYNLYIRDEVLGKNLIEFNANGYIRILEKIDFESAIMVGDENVGVIQDDASVARIVFYRQTDADSIQFSWRNTSATELMTLDYEGDLWIKGNLTQGCLKEFKDKTVDISDTDFLSTLGQLKPKKFTLKDDPKRWRFGLIAEEVPREFQVRDKEGKLTGIDVMAILTYCIGAINQLKKKVEQLETKITS